MSKRLTILLLALIVHGGALSGCDHGNEGISKVPVDVKSPGVSQTMTTEPTVEEVLSRYKSVTPTSLTLPGLGAQRAWFVTARESDVVFGVVVEINGRLVVMRAPTAQAGGLAGPETADQTPPTLETLDLDGDGFMELVLTGIGGRNRAVWVYRFVQEHEKFEFLASLSGLGLTMHKVSGDVVFSMASRDHTAEKTIVTDWHFRNDKFVQM